MRWPAPVARSGRHLARTWRRYRSKGGDSLAASVSYYGFLSFFPLVLLAVSVVGFAVRNSPSAQQSVLTSIQRFLPGALGANAIDLNAIAQHRSSLGAIALVGFIISGTGWLGSLREALRHMWGKEPIQRNFFVSKLFDVGLLAALGVVLAISLALSGVTTQATDAVFHWFGWQNTPGVRELVHIIGLALPFLVDVAFFGYLFSALPHVRTPTRSLIKGAVLGAVVFELLKVAGAYYVARITKGGVAIYGTFGVVIGLVVWLNLVSRVTLFVGAWTATDLRRGVSDEEDSDDSEGRTAGVGGAT